MLDNLPLVAIGLMDLLTSDSSPKSKLLCKEFSSKLCNVEDWGLLEVGVITEFGTFMPFCGCASLPNASCSKA